jgi:MSHA pilin protein MshD
MTSLSAYRNQQGVTLIELIVVMVVISIALAGVMSVINFTTLHSADPMLRQQAIAIAEAYMEEITLKDYVDPDDGTLCPTKEGSRDRYDNVCDYNGLSDTGAADQTGVAIGGLGSYDVAVTVAAATFGSPTVDGLKIEVTVTDSANESLTLTGYRADY